MDDLLEDFEDESGDRLEVAQWIQGGTLDTPVLLDFLAEAPLGITSMPATAQDSSTASGSRLASSSSGEDTIDWVFTL